MNAIELFIELLKGCQLIKHLCVCVHELNKSRQYLAPSLFNRRDNTKQEGGEENMFFTNTYKDTNTSEQRAVRWFDKMRRLLL